MRYFLAAFFFIIILVISIAGFRGSFSTKPPIEIFPDMDNQSKLLPQSEFDFWEDGRVQRPVIPGTVSRGRFEENPQAIFSEDYADDRYSRSDFYTGKTQSGDWVETFPLAVDRELMDLGQEKYTIFCAVCHGAAGDGKGIVAQDLYGLGPVPSYHDSRRRDMPIGEWYDVITNGKGLMLPYADKLRPQERWAVILYVRALQKAANATLADVPDAYKKELK